MIATICSSVNRPFRIAPSDSGASLSTIRRSENPGAGQGTITWFAIQEGPSSFAIFDTFDDEGGRDAHLNGKVAAALMEKVKAGDLFAKTPEIHKLEILADKLLK